MDPLIRQLGLSDYQSTCDDMRRFTNERHGGTEDELWCLEHPPVYTLGLGGKQVHVFDQGNIPVIKTDRGGQVTYHGPGQLVVYCLLDLHRRRLGVKSFVSLLEQSVIDMLTGLGLFAQRREGAPGVYINNKKIAALGIRIRKGCSYHGLALNVDLDLAPFQGIDPCGYPGLEVTRLQDEGIEIGVIQASELLIPILCRHLDRSNKHYQGT